MYRDREKLKEETTRLVNITHIGGKYRYVNHKASVATEGFDTVLELVWNKDSIPFDIGGVLPMKSRYAELYPMHHFKGCLDGSKININDIVANESLLGSLGCGWGFKGGSQKVTRRDLELEYWGPLHDMVNKYNAKHNCDVKPWECVKISGTVLLPARHPEFSSEPEDYSIACAILWGEEAKEHKPVFVGDTLYLKDGGTTRYVVTSKGYYTEGLSDEAYNWRSEDLTGWSWVPPKTKKEREIKFSINGENFTCPEKVESYKYLIFDNKYFYFSTHEDLEQVCSKIKDLLRVAKDE